MTRSQECQPCQPRKLCLFWLDFSFPDVCFSLHPGTVPEPRLSPRARCSLLLTLPPFVYVCFLLPFSCCAGWGRRPPPGLLRQAWLLGPTGYVGVSVAIAQPFQTGLGFWCTGQVAELTEPVKAGRYKRGFPFVFGEAGQTNTMELRTEVLEKVQSHPGLSGV